MGWMIGAPCARPLGDVRDSSDSDRRALIEQVCSELGLGRFAAKAVESWLRTDPSRWPSCCQSGCDPCNDVLRRAALEVLKQTDAAAS